MYRSAPLLSPSAVAAKVLRAADLIREADALLTEVECAGPSELAALVSAVEHSNCISSQLADDLTICWNDIQGAHDAEVAALEVSFAEFDARSEFNMATA